MLIATYRHFFSESESKFQSTNIKNPRDCYLKLFELDGLRGEYEEVRVTNTNWITRARVSAFDISLQSLAVMGHCDWEISW